MRTAVPLKRRGYTLKKAAALLNVHAATVRYWFDKGVIPGSMRTGGGHRWLTREGFLAFAKRRGVEVTDQDERRSSRRIYVHKTPIHFLVRDASGRILAEGRGRLRDLSRRGFRADQVRWRTELVPARGAQVAFEIPSGGLPGVSGIARVAWHQDNRKDRGATLGARLQKIQNPEHRSDWLKYADREVN